MRSDILMWEKQRCVWSPLLRIKTPFFSSDKREKLEFEGLLWGTEI